MILVTFVSALHTHTEREKSSETQTHAGKVSSNKIPQKKKKNERRKATNTTNEDE